MGTNDSKKKVIDLQHPPKAFFECRTLYNSSAQPGLINKKTKQREEEREGVI